MEAAFSQALWLQMGLILLLILAHGFFAGSEIALVSVRRSRIKQLSEEGNARAQLIHRLQEEPDRFIAVAQIGMELLSNLAAAVVALMAASAFAPLLQRIPVVKGGSEGLALSLAILAFTSLNMIVGQLVPKSLALKYSEAIALFVAGPIDRLSRLLSFPIHFLIHSRRALFRFFGVKEAGEGPFVTEEEIKLLLQEGREKGVFDQMEQELISSVFEFT
ncbi:MAG: CNNM domain-containing protein, partial [Candidatus Methylomirabilales bacterium]